MATKNRETCYLHISDNGERLAVCMHPDLLADAAEVDTRLFNGLQVLCEALLDRLDGARVRRSAARPLLRVLEAAAELHTAIVVLSMPPEQRT